MTAATDAGKRRGAVPSVSCWQLTAAEEEENFGTGSGCSSVE